MLDFHEGVTLHRKITTECALPIEFDADAIYCLDAPEAIPAGSTRRVDAAWHIPFAAPSRNWRD